MIQRKLTWVRMIEPSLVKELRKWVGRSRAKVLLDNGSRAEIESAIALEKFKHNSSYFIEKDRRNYVEFHKSIIDNACERVADFVDKEWIKNLLESMNKPPVDTTMAGEPEPLTVEKIKEAMDKMKEESLAIHHKDYAFRIDELVEANKIKIRFPLYGMYYGKSLLHTITTT